LSKPLVFQVLTITAGGIRRFPQFALYVFLIHHPLVREVLGLVAIDTKSFQNKTLKKLNKKILRMARPMHPQIAVKIKS
jgi:hypothetical protein